METSIHPGFTRINGINSEMSIYEQLIMDVSEEDVEIVNQINSKAGRIVFVYSSQSSPKQEGEKSEQGAV